jgi:hypothetical protein
MNHPPEETPQKRGTDSAQLSIPSWVWVLASCAILWFTWSGQQFLAHNVYNDADSSYFAYGGKVLAQGGVLYRDFWDQKPPMIFYQNALLYSCFGLNFKAWALCHGLAFLLTLAWLSRALRSCAGLSPRMTLLWAVIISFAFNLNNYLDFGNRTEFGLALFEMIAMGHTLLFFKHQKNLHLIVAGALCAVATLYKPTGMASLQATIALFFLRWIFKERFKSEAGSVHCSYSISHLLWLLLGFFAFGSIILLPIILEGQLLELWRATITIPLSLSGGTGKSLLQAATECPVRMGPLWGWAWPSAFALPYLIWQWLRRELDPVHLWLLLWTSASFCGIVLMRHGHPHYDHPLVVPLITVSVCTMSRVCQKSSRKFSMTLLILWCCSGIWFSKYFVVRQAKQSVSLEQVHDKIDQPYRDVSLWLKENVSSDHTFYYWSMGYSPYLHSGKPCPGLISPCILPMGDAGAAMVQLDLKRIQQDPRVGYLLENPDTFPKFLSDPTHFEAGSKAMETVKAYLNWRDQKFKKLDLPKLKPFLVYQRK